MKHELHPEQIAHRVPVFEAREPPHHVAAGIRRRARIDASHRALKPPQQLFALGVRRLRLFVRRHVAIAKLLVRVSPKLARSGDRLCIANPFQIHVTPGLLLAMALEAVFRQQRPNFAFKLRLGLRRSAEHHQRHGDAA
ncbi:MAG TPA: hypothetical protein VGO11_03495 [Chthoniobacteraceae bacterium]|nr:hypothetical protein [Chthoniobacteraceae bacterium]